MIDVCVHTCCRRDVECLDVFLYSLERFGDLPSCNLLVSHSSSDAATAESLVAICESYRTRSLNIDFFDTNEVVDSNQHGEALNRLIARTTSEHVILTNPDVIVTSPGWLDFCIRHIDQGCFVVGMPFDTPDVMWQDNFPTVWLSMLDGKELRTAHLDMRTEHVRLHRGNWLLVCENGVVRDMGWELADHAFENGLDWISLTLGLGHSRLAFDMRSWTSHSLLVKRSRRRMGKWLQELGAIEFLYPGTDEMCCVHLHHGAHHGIGGPRTDKWVVCAKMAVDMYAESN